MKLFLSLIALSVLSANANAATLRCASKKGESLYYTEGQLVLVAGSVISDELLSNASLELLPASKLGVKEQRVVADKKRSTAQYVRFNLGADAWCNYRLTLPRGYSDRGEAFPAFVDANCEENSNYSIRMSCSI